MTAAGELPFRPPSKHWPQYLGVLPGPGCNQTGHNALYTEIIQGKKHVQNYYIRRPKKTLVSTSYAKFSWTDVPHCF